MSADGQNSNFFFEFSQEQRLNWLRLYRSQNVGPRTFRDLISHFGTAAAALEAIPDIAKRGGAASRISVASIEDAEKELVHAERVGARYVAMGEQDYPALLRQIDTAPPIICCKGNVAIFRKKALAIVGSRNASVSGMRLTERLASEMGSRDFVIVSGLARGIDTAAHKASIETGTMAVLAGGIDNVYPTENRELADEITSNGGVLISEMPPGYQAVANDFPKRNRIVAGLAQGVLVIEAATRSGSLITARLGNESGRIVMAIPGSPLDPRSAGTNTLIREGATLITSADDIVEALTPMHGSQQEFVYDISEDAGENEEMPDDWTGLAQEPSTNMRERIVSSIGSAPVEIDDIIRFCDADPGEVQLVLLELALAGRLERHAGNRVSLIEPHTK